MTYKVRVFLDTKDDIFRDIEIKANQTLWNLHNGIKSAFSLQGDDLSVYNILEDDGTIVKSVPLEDMSDDGDGEIMSDVYLKEVFQEKGDKGHFQYGFLDLWEFICELIEISEEKSAVNYPITVFRFGNVPLKAPGKKSGGGKKSAVPLMDDDFNEFSEFGAEGNFSDEDDDNYDDEEEDYDDENFDDEDDAEENYRD